MIISVSSDVSRRSSMKSQRGRRPRSRASVVSRRSLKGWKNVKVGDDNAREGRLRVLAKVIVASIRKLYRRERRDDATEG